VRAKKVDPTRLITHHFKLDAMIEAYETFGDAAKTGALKVILTA
jgi:alcohol dehydrogenase